MSEDAMRRDDADYLRRRAAAALAQAKEATDPAARAAHEAMAAHYAARLATLDDEDDARA